MGNRSSKSVVQIRLQGSTRDKLKEYLEELKGRVANSKDRFSQSKTFSTFWNTYRMNDMTNTLKTT